MSLDFGVIDNIGKGMEHKFGTLVRHPLLRTLRMLGVSQKDIARALGVSPAQVRRLEQYSGFLADEEECALVNLLLIAQKCARNVRRVLRFVLVQPNLHPVHKVVAEEQMKDLDAAIAASERVVEEVFRLTTRWTF